MIVVAYYTVGTQIDYKAMVPRFVQSLKKFRLKYDIEEIRDRGSWRKNLGYRPHFLLKMLNKHQEPILSIDVDAIVLSRPNLLLDNPVCDTAFHCYLDEKPCGGTLYFANTEMARKILQAWIDKDKEMPNSRSDEFVLKKLFCKRNGIGRFATKIYLPVSYMGSPSYMRVHKDVIFVVAHDVVSCYHPNKPAKSPMPGRKKRVQTVRKSVSKSVIRKFLSRKPVIERKSKQAGIISAKERRRQADRMQPGWAPGKPTRHRKKVPPGKRRGVF